MPSTSHYPLTLGNTWTYQVKGGQAYITKVTEQNGDVFTVHTTMVNASTKIKRAGDEYISDSPEAGKTIVSFKENLNVGDTWQNSYKVNGIDSTLTYVVKEVGTTKDVGGKTFKDVVFIEADSKMSMNGNALPMKYVTQYYYAKGVGLILTTSSMGDEHALTEYEVK